MDRDNQEPHRAVKRTDASTTLGTAFIDVFLPNGSTSASFKVQGMEGAVPGDVTIPASAPGFNGNSGTATLLQPTLELSGLATSIGAASADDPFRVLLGIPNVFLNDVQEFQAIRPGGTALTAAA